MSTIPVVCNECGHTFSSGIEMTAGITGYGNLSVCPNCKNTTPIPDVIQGVIQDSANISLSNSVEPNKKFIDTSKKRKISDGIMGKNHKSKIQNEKKLTKGINYAIQDFKDYIGIDLNATVAFIQQIQGGLSHSIHYSNLERLIKLLLVNYKAFYTVGHGLSCFRGIKVSRDRLITGIKPGGEFTKISRFSYKPSKITNEYGRCHQPENPIFYASSTRETVFSELDVESDDFVLIGCWQAQNDKQFRYIHIGALDYYRKTRRIPILVRTPDEYKMVQRDISNEVNSRLSDKEEFGLHSMLIDAFFSDVFSKPAYTFKEYKITSIVSNYLFENRKFDILGYPSVKHFGSTNYALKPKTVDENFKLKKILLLKITTLMGFGLYGKEYIAEVTIEQNNDAIVWPVDHILSKT